MSLGPLSIVIGIDPEAFTLGPVSVRWYGLFYIVAIAAAVVVVQRLAMRLRVDIEALWDLFPIALVAGLLGGRLYYVVQNDPGSYLDRPMEIVAVWSGGMAFFGAVIGITAAILAFAWRRRTSPWPILDAVAVAAVIGQPIGRIGNIINGDIIGYPTALPWGTLYTHERAFVPDLNVAYHPAAAYALLVGLLLAAAIVWLVRRGPPAGTVFASYLIGYSATQFLVFFWRANSVTLWGLKQAQLTAIAVALVGVAVMVVVHRRARNGEPRPVVESAAR